MSENIKSFLDFLRECESLLRISQTNESDCNDKTQDILHALELNELSYHDTAKLAKKLKVVRQERRAAKDIINQVLPITTWIEDNRTVIKSLERLLGEVRKEENYIKNRVYNTKTSILEDESAGDLK